MEKNLRLAAIEIKHFPFHERGKFSGGELNYYEDYLRKDMEELYGWVSIASEISIEGGKQVFISLVTYYMEDSDIKG